MTTMVEREIAIARRREKEKMELKNQFLQILATNDRKEEIVQEILSKALLVMETVEAHEDKPFNSTISLEAIREELNRRIRAYGHLL